jgi:hypothetical protein
MAAEIKNLKDLQNVEYSLEKLFADAEDFLPLLGTDYVELYVGNAKQSAHYYKTAFGFQSEAYAGLETGLKDRVSYVLKQDKIRLVLTTPLTSDSPINEHIKKMLPKHLKKRQNVVRNLSWSQHAKRMKMVMSCVQVFIPTEKPYTFLLSAKITMEFSFQDIENGNHITIQNQLV